MMILTSVLLAALGLGALWMLWVAIAAGETAGIVGGLIVLPIYAIVVARIITIRKKDKANR
jgi:predicted PurR-regulated permease PerM